MKIPLKMLVVLAIYNNLNYKDIEKLTHYHPNTVSRYITILDKFGIIKISHNRSNNLRGKKWINIISLKQEFQNPNMKIFFENISKALKVKLDDLFVD